MLNGLVLTRENVNNHLAEYESYQVTVLQVACRNDDIELLQQTLALGADVNQCNAFHYSPLDVCCTYNNLKCAFYLLEIGADPNLWTHKHLSSIQIAYKQQNTRMIALLLDYGADWPSYKNDKPQYIAHLKTERFRCKCQVSIILASKSKSTWFCHDVMRIIAKHLWSLRFKDA